MITVEDVEAAELDAGKRWELFDRVAQGEGVSRELDEAACAEEHGREVRNAGKAKADTLGDDRTRAAFLVAVRQGVPLLQAADAIGSSGYLVLCRMTTDPKFRHEMQMLLPPRPPLP